MSVLGSIRVGMGRQGTRPFADCFVVDAGSIDQSALGCSRIEIPEFVEAVFEIEVARHPCFAALNAVGPATRIGQQRRKRAGEAGRGDSGSSSRLVLTTYALGLLVTQSMYPDSSS